MGLLGLCVGRSWKKLPGLMNKALSTVSQGRS